MFIDVYSDVYSDIDSKINSDIYHYNPVKMKMYLFK